MDYVNLISKFPSFENLCSKLCCLVGADGYLAGIILAALFMDRIPLDPITCARTQSASGTSHKIKTRASLVFSDWNIS